MKTHFTNGFILWPRIPSALPVAFGPNNVQRRTSSAKARQTQKQTRHSLELALLLVHLDHITGRIVKANHSIMRERL